MNISLNLHHTIKLKNTQIGASLNQPYFEDHNVNTNESSWETYFF